MRILAIHGALCAHVRMRLWHACRISQRMHEPGSSFQLRSFFGCVAALRLPARLCAPLPPGRASLSRRMYSERRSVIVASGVVSKPSAARHATLVFGRRLGLCCQHVRATGGNAVIGAAVGRTRSDGASHPWTRRVVIAYIGARRALGVCGTNTFMERRAPRPHGGYWHGCLLVVFPLLHSIAYMFEEAHLGRDCGDAPGRQFSISSPVFLSM